jgi:hypothetical protein
MEITRTSLLSGVTRTRDLPISSEQWAAFNSGAHIQNALSHLSDGDREFILTGSTEEEWDAEFKEIGECSQCGEPVTQSDVDAEALKKTGEITCHSCLAEVEGDGCCPGCGACPGFTGADCDETCEWATTGGGAA